MCFFLNVSLGISDIDCEVFMKGTCFVREKPALEQKAFAGHTVTYTPAPKLMRINVLSNIHRVCVCVHLCGCACVLIDIFFMYV